MGTTLNAYLSFRGNAREAMEFYAEVFGGNLTVSTFGENQAPTDPGEADLVMHADLEGPDGLRLMGSDTPNHMEYRPGTNVSLSLSGDDGAALSGYFEKLSDGGSVTMPLEAAPWGDMFGMCTDRFGMQWMVNITATRG
jgi:PhnB protein